MANVNKVILIGNLTRDPELRVTPKGMAVCQFGLAVNRTFKDESGQSREETTFIDVEAWSKQAELIGKYCTKGRPLYVEGRLKLDQWDDKTSGQKRSKLKVVLENFQFLGGREGGAPGAGGPAAGGEDFDQTGSGGGGGYERSSPPPRAPRAPAAPPPPPAGGSFDEDVPF